MECAIPLRPKEKKRIIRILIEDIHRPVGKTMFRFFYWYPVSQWKCEQLSLKKPLPALTVKAYR